MPRYPRKTKHRHSKPGRKYKKSGVLNAYPDKHNFKIMATSTFIASQQGTTGVPVGTGQLALGVPIKTPNGLWQQTGVFQFGLSANQQFSTLAALYDRFKVNMIKIRCLPEANVASSAGPDTVPVMRFIYDYDDMTAPPNCPYVWARRGVQKRMDKPFTLTLKPKIIVPGVTINNTQVNALVMPTQWTNCAIATQPVQMYGIKFGLRDFLGNSTNNNVIRFEITYYVSFKEQLLTNASWTASDVGVFTGNTTQYLEVDPEGNMYDQDAVLKYELDPSGNEVPVV